MGRDSGQDDFTKMRQKLEDVRVPQDVSLGSIFPDGFMEEYTDFERIEDFLEKGGLSVGYEEASGELDGEGLDGFVRENTRFDSWKEMLAKGGQIWLGRKLTDG